MNTLEIESNEWAKFFQMFNETNRGSMLTIHKLAPDGNRETIAEQLPLRSMTFDKTGACSDVLRIEVGGEGSRVILHEVIEPIHIRLAPNGEGKSIQIVAESGTTLVTVISGRLPQWNRQTENAPSEARSR